MHARTRRAHTHECVRTYTRELIKKVKFFTFKLEQSYAHMRLCAPADIPARTHERMNAHTPAHAHARTHARMYAHERTQAHRPKRTSTQIHLHLRARPRAHKYIHARARAHTPSHSLSHTQTYTLERSHAHEFKYRRKRTHKNITPGLRHAKLSCRRLKPPRWPIINTAFLAATARWHR